MDEKKLIYIVNEYSSNSAQHFYHVVNLLENIACHGVKITLVIEKCHDMPAISNPNIQVVPQKESESFKRAAELSGILKSRL